MLRSIKKLLMRNDKAKIYGVSWDKSSNPVLTRTNDSVGMIAQAGLDSQYVNNTFDTAEIYRDIVNVTDSHGNVFVRIPKFYIRKTDGATKTWQISKQMFTGAYLPWCFWNFTTNTELPYVDVGKYNANLNSTKLESKSGTVPLINTNIVDYRTYAMNNGTGYQQLDIHVADVLQVLFLVEFATLNSQSIMAGFTSGELSGSDVATVAETGVNRIILANARAALFYVGQTISVGTSTGDLSIFYGRTITSKTVYDVSNTAINFDGTAVNIAVNNVVWTSGWKSGFSSGIVAKSGGIISLSNAKYPCMYRGIENPWGSMWQFVDGLNINNYQSWICKNQAGYASNVFASPYEQIGYVNSNTSSNYVKFMSLDSNYPFVELPTTTTGGSSTTYYSDYYYPATGQKVAIMGGTFNSGVTAGLFMWSLNSLSSVASILIAGRLVRKAL